MKKILSSTIIACTLLGTGVMPAGAESNLIEEQLTENDFTETINLLSTDEVPGVEIVDITREQYVEIMARNQNIPYAEADKLVSQVSKARASGDVIWRTATWTQTYSKNSNYKAELEGAFEVYVYDSFREIISCTVGSSLAAGKNKATWVQSNSFKTTKFPVTTATVGVQGKFYATYTNTSGVSGGAGGFSVSSSTSNTTTLVSESMKIQKEFSVY